MIAYFPTPYEDELLYSVFARYYAHSCHTTFQSAAAELFVSNTRRPDVLYFNELTSDAVRVLTQNCSFEEIIERHTMFSYHALFLSEEKRANAMDALIHMRGNFSNVLVTTPNRHYENNLKYCPLCVEEDREKYAEAYWHHFHQIPEINVCPVHGCKLHCSCVTRAKGENRNLLHAELNIENMDVHYGSEVEIGLAKYVKELMDNFKNINSGPLNKEFISSYLRKRNYLSYKGDRINLEQLMSDFNQYFKDVPGIKHGWQISHLLKGSRTNTYEQMQLAYFLKVSCDDLMGVTKCEDELLSANEKRILELVKKGMSGREIAGEIDVTPTTIYSICKKNHVKPAHIEKSKPKMSEDEYRNKIESEREFWLKVVNEHPDKTFSELRSRPEYFSRMNWLRRHDKEWTDQHFPHVKSQKTLKSKLEEMDERLLPEVQRIIADLKKKDAEVPQKISIYTVDQYLKVSAHHIYHLPKCIAEINKYQETYEQFWARKLRWALHKMIETGEKTNVSRLKRMTGLNRDRIEKCYPLIVLSGDEEVIKIVEDWKDRGLIHV